MTPNASKQGKLDSFGAIFLFIFLPCMWGLGFQNDSPPTSADFPSLGWTFWILFIFFLVGEGEVGVRGAGEWRDGSAFY